SQTFFIGPHQKTLANGGTSLQMAQVARPLVQPEPANTGADRPGTDQGYLSALFTQSLHLVRQALEALRVQLAIWSRQNVRPNFDHDRVGQGDHFLADRIEHWLVS